ncbi:MAG: thiamine pyrophosphate-dependent dehydrogenase E1 component subunit alpha [Nitrospirae bacterium]|nr:MAG: thiamine pyrophosphate-dependent dehydrogenase E1 component subunit alpha [Nitrospirota bacterium]
MSSEILKKILFTMVRIRLVQEKIAEKYPEQKMRCPVHLCIGQEAIGAGVCTAMDKDDYLFSNHRSHCHYLAKGGDLNAMIAEIYGKATGCAKGKGGSMHLVDVSANILGAVPIVGGVIPVALGAAFGTSLKKENKVTVVFFGDGASEEGVFYESLNFAALKKLPIVFVCENNFYSVYSPLSVRQPSGRDNVALARSFGIHSKKSDGNDAEGVYNAAKEAIEIARSGNGPSLLEFDTYRYREHCGPAYDDHLGYRAECEIKEWTAKCPIEIFRNKLLTDNAVGQNEIDFFVKETVLEIEKAFEFAENSPFPDSDELTKDVYA